MEKPFEITHLVWSGTFIVISMAFGIIILALIFQNRVWKIKQKEADLLFNAARESEINERNRIARDLHDSVLGDLSSVKLLMRLIEKKQQILTTNELWIDLQAAIDNASTNTREITNNIMPPLLESHGLCVAIKSYIFNLSQNNISFNFTFNDHVYFPSTVSYEVFRVVQELITNMIKYSDAKQCEMTIISSGKIVALDIYDNGNYFDFKKSLSTSTGNGLKNIKSRLKSIDAEIKQKEYPNGNHLTILIKNHVKDSISR